MKKKTHLFDKFSDEEFIAMARNSESMSEFVLKLGYASGEGTNSRNNVREHCVELGIEPPRASHATLTKAAIQKNTMTNEKYFQKGTVHTGHNTRERLIKSHLLEYRCAVCGNTGVWEGEPLTLEVDHINGDHQDNRLSNLRFLCPNCHAQTETFRGKKHTKI